MRELPGQSGHHVAEVLVDGKIQVFEIQQTDVVGMEESESDYSIVHLTPEGQGLPAFHRLVGEPGEARQYCSLESMEPVTSSGMWNPPSSQPMSSPLYELQVGRADSQRQVWSVGPSRTRVQSRGTRWSRRSRIRTSVSTCHSPQM